ncbi:MAG TPA: hypothetical protein VNA13_00840 [Xanthomonadales bacterium]|nr:hypothetical protein [Xanthomonadales bacterium]
MDPASLSNLDPKLRETYERVMGATTPAVSDTPPTADNPTPPEAGATSTVATPIAADTAPITPSTDELSPTIPAPVMENSAPSDQPQTVTINQPLPNPTSMNQLKTSHGHMGLIKILYILGAIMFFVIYIFFWMKILNLNLPF